MIETHGLSHVALAVIDPDRSLAFYKVVFDVREYFRSDSTIQVLGPGPYHVLAFEKRPADAGASGRINHFGVRLPLDTINWIRSSGRSRLIIFWMLNEIDCRLPRQSQSFREKQQGNVCLSSMTQRHAAR